MRMAPMVSLDGNGEPQMDTALEDPWTLEGKRIPLSPSNSIPLRSVALLPPRLHPSIFVSNLPNLFLHASNWYWCQYQLSEPFRPLSVSFSSRSA
jgi:hypothetical protein